MAPSQLTTVPPERATQVPYRTTAEESHEALRRFVHDSLQRAIDEDGNRNRLQGAAAYRGGQNIDLGGWPFTILGIRFAFQPFKVTDRSIVIVKELPVLQCQSCAEHLIEDTVMDRVEELLSSVDRAAELEIIRFAA